MSKVGVRDENYPVTKFGLCSEVLRLDSGLAQANFGPIPGAERVRSVEAARNRFWGPRNAPAAQPPVWGGFAQANKRMGCAGYFILRTDGATLRRSILCPLGEVLRLDSGLTQANFGPVPGGRLPVGDGYA